MEKLEVLMVSPISLNDDFMEVIAAVDPRISVKNAAAQFVDELRKSGRQGQFVDLLEGVATRTNPGYSSVKGETFDDLLAKAEVIWGVVLFPDNLLSRAPKLKWLQIGGTGIDPYKPMGIFNGKIIVTNSRGTQAIPIAEYVLSYMFMMAKDARRLLENQRNALWDPYLSHELRDKTVGIVGFGTIGLEIARLAKGIGMRVVAVKRSASRIESNVFGIDTLYPTTFLRQMLSESDYVVMAVPLTQETRMMIGEDELRAMKRTTRLINIGRGETVDQSALIKALKKNMIAGAAIDVFEVEPLPSDNELWRLPNAIVSSHASGATEKRGERVINLFCENIRRYIAGQDLLNVIDENKGY